MYPSNIQFTRQQMSAATGLADDVLAYWLKEGIIRPTAGGSGKGSHRKFDYVQVHIAAILREVRQFGVNIASLREVSDILQRGVDICSRHSFHRASFREAAYFVTSLLAFQSGEPVRIFDRDTDDFRSAVNEVEIAHHHSSQFDHDEWELVEAFARTLQGDDIIAVRLYADLTDPDNLIEVGVGKAENWDEKLWSIWRDSDGRWRVNEPHAMPHGVMSSVSIAVSLVIRRLWSSP